MPQKMICLKFYKIHLLNGNIKPIVEKVVNLCETCIKFRKLLPQPIVAFLKVDDFNETVSLDLHQLQLGLWYMHMKDEFTKFSAAAIIASKIHGANVFIKGTIFMKFVSDSILKYKQKQHSGLGVTVFANDSIRLCRQFYWK